MKNEIDLHYSKNNHVTKMFTAKAPKWAGRQSSTKVWKYNCSKANLRRLEAFLFMHYEGLQQPSLTLGARLLELPAISHFTQNCSAALENPFRWPAELWVEGGEFEEGAI